MRPKKLVAYERHASGSATSSPIYPSADAPVCLLPPTSTPQWRPALDICFARAYYSTAQHCQHREGSKLSFRSSRVSFIEKMDRIALVKAKRRCSRLAGLQTFPARRLILLEA